MGFWLTNIKCQQKIKQYNFSKGDHGTIIKMIFSPNLKKTEKWQGCLAQIQLTEEKNNKTKNINLFL